MSEELARRAVACPGWRLLPGMLDQDGWRLIRDCGSYWMIGKGSCTHLPGARLSLPDLTDAATRGCLLALVREAWDCPLIGIAYDADDGEWRAWHIVWPDGHPNEMIHGLEFPSPTEAEALVAALEAAPRKEGA